LTKVNVVAVLALRYTLYPETDPLESVQRRSTSLQLIGVAVRFEGDGGAASVVVVVMDVLVVDVVVVGGRVVVVVVVNGRMVVVVVNGRVVVVVDPGKVVVVEPPGGVTVRLKVPCAPPNPSTTMKYVCPAVTVGVMREARFKPVALGHASSLHPDTTWDPVAHTPLRM